VKHEVLEVDQVARSAAQHGRQPSSYYLVLELFDFMTRLQVSGGINEFLEALFRYLVASYGFMAPCVMRALKITSGADILEIIAAMRVDQIAQIDLPTKIDLICVGNLLVGLDEAVAEQARYDMSFEVWMERARGHSAGW